MTGRRLLIALVVLLLSDTASTAAACALDQVPSMSMNGQLAVPNTHPAQTAGDLRHWAPFVFRGHPAPGQAVKLSENRHEVARSLTRQAMQRAPQWQLGDGTVAFGWSVTHRYITPGIRRVTVRAYDPGSRKWYPFDEATITILKK